MVTKIDFYEVCEAAVNDLILGIHDLSGESIGINVLDQLHESIIDGNERMAGVLASAIIYQTPIAPVKGKQLINVIEAFTRLLPLFNSDSVSRPNMLEFAQNCAITGDIFKFVSRRIAYNLYEYASTTCQLINERHFSIAENLLSLADRNNIDQYHRAIWVYAIERLLKSHTEGKDYLAAIDAFETAINVRVENKDLHEMLCDLLFEALYVVQDSKLIELLFIAVLLCGSEKRQQQRIEFLKKIIKKNDTPEVSENMITAQLIVSVLNSQMSIDNLRFSQFDFPNDRGSLSWSDHTLTHKNLTHAVPLMRSLIRDISRTGRFLLDLTHEITHAVSLIGAIGNNRMALRVATQVCEMILVSSENDPIARSKKGLVPLEKIPDNFFAFKVAEIQLGIIYKSNVLESTWRSWLEGVAMYVELLCDPKDDPNEISPIHEAIRSLIDINLDRLPNESDSDYSARYAEEYSKQYEDFHSEALKRLSEERHLGYMGLFPSSSHQKELRDIYLCGYLVVRSIIASWEKTLGFRLEPCIASKLLVFLTRYSTYDAIPDLATDITVFSLRSEELFVDWLHTISQIEKEDLQSFFEEVDKTDRGKRYGWKNKRLQLLDIHEDRSKEEMDLAEKVIDNINDLVLGKGLASKYYENVMNDVMASTVSESQSAIRTLYFMYSDFIALLPVGRDFSRLLFMTDEGRVAICPRTYIGFSIPQEDNIHSRQKYSPFIFTLKGGADEVTQLRKICGKNLSGRVLATRIIDFQGSQHPFRIANQSLVCFFMEEGWERITINYGSNEQLGDEYKEYIDLLRQRVYSPGFFADEIGTLSSLQYLLNRFHSLNIKSDIYDIANSFDNIVYSRDVSIAAFKIAFHIDDSEDIEFALNTLSIPNVKWDISKYLYSSGTMKESHNISQSVLGEMIYDNNSFSGIKPF